MSAHTPGPWEVYRDGEVRHIVAAGSVVDEPNGTLQADWVAELEPDSTGHDEEQCEADAYLIAAAPSMYELLARMYVEDGAALRPETCASVLALLAQVQGKDSA